MALGLPALGSDTGGIPELLPAECLVRPGSASSLADTIGRVADDPAPLLPTGNAVDLIDGVEATLVNNGMPVVVVRANDLNVTGYETCEELESNAALRGQIESIRLQAGELMGLGDVSDATVPKLTIVAAPREGGAVATRTFIPHRCHQAIGVFGAVSVATACLIEGKSAYEIAEIDGASGVVTLEHPSGTFEAIVALSDNSPSRAGFVRTTRKLMDGFVFPREY